MYTYIYNAPSFIFLKIKQILDFINLVYFEQT